ncbi:MAG: DUF5683 domain-containing protein [Cyclobacteriaceae bacterium]
MMHASGWMTLLVLLLVIGPVFAQEEGEVSPDTTVSDTTIVAEDTLQNNNQATIGPNRPGTNPPDTIRIQSMAAGHSPRKAALFSAVLPGLGQVYNGKYWKVPIIYAGFATLGYFVIHNNDRYNLFRRALFAEQSGETNPLVGIQNGRFEDPTSIQRGIDQFRRDRDFMIILITGMYALNIMDAIVDAHLIEFDINPELSFDLKPVAGSSLAYTGHLTPTIPTYGLSFTLNLP